VLGAGQPKPRTCGRSNLAEEWENAAFRGVRFGDFWGGNVLNFAFCVKPLPSIGGRREEAYLTADAR
jgi:hypothetical protein